MTTPASDIRALDQRSQVAGPFPKYLSSSRKDHWSTSPARPRAPRVDEEYEARLDLAKRRDNVLRAVKWRPWSSAEAAAQVAGVELQFARDVLEGAVAEGLLVARGRYAAVAPTGPTARLAQALQATPWLATKQAQEAIEPAPRNAAEQAIRGMARRGTVDAATDRDGATRWALAGTRVPSGWTSVPLERASARRVYAVRGLRKVAPDGRSQRPLTQVQRRVLGRVLDDPWRTAAHYHSYASGLRRNATYSTLQTLARRGLIRKASHRRILHFGPPKGPLPAGFSELLAEAPSPLRQGGRERLVVFLGTAPWQTVASLARHLRLTAKAVDNLVRDKVRAESIVRREFRGAFRDVFAYALPASPEPTPADEARILAEGQARLPSRFGKTTGAVLRALEKRPWMSAGEIQACLPKLTLGAVNSALKTLTDGKAVRRAPDGVYRYAPADGRPTPKFSGVLKKRASGEGKWARRIIEELKASPTGLSRKDLITRTCGGPTSPNRARVIYAAVARLQKRGCVRVEKRRAPRGSGAGKDVEREVLVHVHDDIVATETLLRTLDELVDALHARGVDAEEHLRARRGASHVTANTLGTTLSAFAIPEALP